MRVFRFLHYYQLVVLSLDFVNSIGEFLTKSLVLVALDSNRRRLDVPMLSPSRTLNLNLPAIFVVDDA